MAEASINYWYEALGSQFGIVIMTDNPERCRQQLYKLREQAADPSLADISVVISPSNPGSHVWLVKRKPSETQGK